MINDALVLVLAGRWTVLHCLGSPSRSGNSISNTGLYELQEHLPHLEICTAHKCLVGCGEVSNR